MKVSAKANCCFASRRGSQIVRLDCCFILTIELWSVHEHWLVFPGLSSHFSGEALKLDEVE